MSAGEVRVRHGRVALVLAATSTTLVAVLGAAGLLPQGAAARPGPADLTPAVLVQAGSGVASRQAAAPLRRLPPAAEAVRVPVAVPPHSGEGRRVVFSEAAQRVWLVEGDGSVQRTYLVSGSIYDNLDPGSYEVYSRSEQAWGIDDSGTMRWFVRFTRGDSGSAIGFHDIPVDEGRRVQTFDQLGTPLSHGCIRQRPADARALWRFAPLGTSVVVV